MNDDQVHRAIDEMERSLRVDDPALLGRLRALQRRQALDVVAVFSLLVAASVLLGVGLLRSSAIVWCAGLGAYLASFAVDRWHKRYLRGTHR